uniref:Brix domain-containing protein n=1 Tax=Coccolithus braarudii TaxID=221442 RepID=A0A7S0L3C5_9EUKA
MAKKRSRTQSDGDREIPSAPGAAAAPAASSSTASEVRYPAVTRKTTHLKKKVLVLCSRGVTSSNIELLEDVLKLLPHGRKDSKFDKRELLSNVTEIAELAGCHYCLYFEARKMKDLYLWVANVERGPSVKFLVQQVKGMGDLRLTGNCLLGSRAILSFDKAFSDTPHLQVLQVLLRQTFSIPKGHPRSKPFHDHVLNFSLLRGRIIVRHYQVLPPTNGSREDDTLVEIGPRLALTPIKMLAGPFSGETLYANDKYVSPNTMRSQIKRKASRHTLGHVKQKERHSYRLNEQGAAELPEDQFADVFE